MTGFSDFPLPDDSVMYPRHQELHSYLLRYAEHFKLRPHIVFNTRVVDIRKLDGLDEQHGKWEIHVETKDQSVKYHIFDAVMLCSGFYGGPNIPQIPGLDEFEGLVMHSREFRNGLRFTNQRVLVVGKWSITRVTSHISIYYISVATKGKDDEFVSGRKHKSCK